MQNTFANDQFDTLMTWNTTNFDNNDMLGGFPQQAPPNAAGSDEMDYSGFDPAEIEFHKYVQCNS